MPQIESPLSYFTRLPDPRKPTHIQHRWETLWQLLFLGVSAAQPNLLALSQWIEDQHDALCDLLQVKQLPRQATLYRFLAELNPEQVEKAFQAWITPWLPEDQVLKLVMDAKMLKGSGRSRQEVLCLQVFGLYCQQLKSLIYQRETPQYNEVGAAQQSLAFLQSLTQPWVVSGDAVYTGKQLVEHIQQAGGDYFLVVKNNQKRLKLAIEQHFDQHPTPGHQHTEVRSGEVWCWTTRVSYDLSDGVTQGWKGVRAVVEMQREVFCKVSKKVRLERHVAISSRGWKAEEAYHLWRGHWGIENRVHHARDTVFKEDACRNRSGGQALAVFRNVILALTTRADEKVLRLTRKFQISPLAAWQFLGFPS